MTRLFPFFVAPLLFVACNSTLAPDVLFDGSESPEKAGFQASSGALSIKRDESGNEALSVTGTGVGRISLRLNAGDLANSVGVQFRIRASDPVRFSVHTSASLPSTEGGSCVSQCVPYRANLSVGTEWTTVVALWSDLSLEGGVSASTLTPDTVVQLNWEIDSVDAYDVWLDDLEILRAGGPSSGLQFEDDTASSGGTGGTDTSSGGTSTGGTTSTNALGKYVTKTAFEGVFPERNSLYTYEQLLAVVDDFPEFAGCCSEDDQKREVAAFLAHVQHESDFLKATDEYNPGGIYCDPGSVDQSGATIGCAGGADYHGRGALQISWNYNYRFAETFLSQAGHSYNLWANPAQVSSDGYLLWATAMWFWMQGDPSYSNPPHVLIRTDGFGATIRKINGGLECDGANPTAVGKRVQYFKEWCTRIGVDPGANLTC